MEEVNPEMEGENWSVTRHPIHKNMYVAKHINIWGSESHTCLLYTSDAADE